MTYDPRIHHRRSIRLRGHDYGGGGAYFVTCCVEAKECLFGRVMESTMLVNECGELLPRAWAAIPQRFPSVMPDAFQVMPNHWHGMLVIPGPGLEPSLAVAVGAPVTHPTPTGTLAGASPGPTKDNRPSLGDVMGAIKSIATIAVNRLLSRTGRAPSAGGLFRARDWQRGFSRKDSRLYPHKPGGLAGGTQKTRVKNRAVN
jgi:putative transposase